jgi:phosphoribosylaminoimidazole carboxylase (NCAIR synthetase)
MEQKIGFITGGQLARMMIQALTTPQEQYARFCSQQKERMLL